MIVGNFVLKSSNIDLLTSIDLLVVYALVVLTKEFSNSDIFIVILLLITGDLPTYEVFALNSIIFFTSYLLLSLIERIVPSLVRGLPISPAVLLFIIYYLLRLLLVNNVSFAIIVENLILLIIAQIVFKSTTGYRRNEI